MKKYSKDLLDVAELHKTKNVVNELRNVKLKTLLIFETSFLPTNTSNIERLYYVKNNLFNIVRCEVCDNPTNISYIKKKYVIKTCSVKCGKLKIDPVSGLTEAKRSNIKTIETKNKVNIETGLNVHQITGLKVKNTMSQVNFNTGLTGYENSVIKVKQTRLDIEIKTGLNSYTVAALKGAKLMIKTKNEITYDKRLNLFPKEYILITSKVDYITNDDKILEYSHICGSIRKSYWPYIRCTKCYPYETSIGESNVLDYCKSLTSNTISNTRQIIKPLELDIYLPDHNLAIEYDGIYWHSSEYKPPNYHLLKTRECGKFGIQLFHIFENEWQDPQKQKIWKSIIRNRLGQSERIYGRKTEIKSVTSKDKTEFLNSNHLQGTCGSSMNLGLYLGDELVSLMTFGKSRYDKKVEWELLRFCNRMGTSVIGGASKLLKAFKKDNTGSIVSYADKRRSNGNLYKQLGFEFSHESNPNYFYCKTGSINLESRLKYQKHKLKDKLKLYDSDLTESENMYKNCYRKIYDCGNQVWILH